VAADNDSRVEQVRQGLFSGIYEAEVSYVCQSLHRLGVASSEIEDVAHEVFVTAYNALGQYDTARPLRPWLFGIAARLASNNRRLARHTREVGGVGFEAVDEGLDPEHAASARQDRALVARALESLDEDQRAVFVMYELDGHAMADIAESLAIPVNTAYSRLRLARADFAKTVRRLNAIEAGRGES
jgi:RNA polymerase sigma-70 factor, ECF subfamily